MANSIRTVSIKTVALACTAALALGACTTATPYQPVGTPHSASGGFSEQRIEANRFRVSFAGNSMTRRETVETYLLFRAAELTVNNGYDWFQLVERDTERKTNTYVDRPFGPGPWGYWGPSWRYHGAFGWRAWSPWYGDPFWADNFDVRTVDRYEATAEIVMGRGAKPADPRSFDARQVMENLRSQIVLPQ